MRNVNYILYSPIEKSMGWIVLSTILWLLMFLEHVAMKNASQDSLLALLPGIHSSGDANMLTRGPPTCKTCSITKILSQIWTRFIYLFTY